MPTIGATETTNVNGWTSVSNTTIYRTALKAASNVGGIATALIAYVRDNGSSDQYQLGIYEGGTDSDSNGATLLWDSGAQDADGAGTGTWKSHSINSGAGVSITAGQTLHFVFCLQSSANLARCPADGSEDGDLYTETRSTGVTTHTIGSALPASLGTQGGQTYTDPIKFRMTYAEGGDISIPLICQPAPIVLAP